MTILISDHDERAKSNLLPRWRDGVNIRKVIDAIMQELQEGEQVLFDMITDRLLSNAEGANLDQYGDLVDLERNGLSDDEYRGLLIAKILANRRGHLASEVGNIAAPFFDSVTAGARYVHNQPACFQLIVTPESVLSPEIIALAKQIIENAAPAGVCLTHVTADAAGSFKFDTPGQGFDDGLFIGTI